MSLTESEAAHAASITDPNPVLAPVPAAATIRVLIASVVRKPPEVIAAWLQTLAWQRTRGSVECSYVFYPNFSDTDTYKQPALDVLTQFCAGQPRARLAVNRAAPPADYGHGVTRHWTPDAWHRVGAIKNELLQLAVQERFDYVWLIDADVLCDPYTLQSMLDCDAPITSAVYWTFWRKPNPGEAQRQHCGPQVWMRHPYEMSGRGYTAEQFRTALIGRERLDVGGLGACTLIHRSAIEKGASFAKVGEFPAAGLMDGEDRHFCIRASRLHIPLTADAWPDIYHAYHPDEYPDIPAQLERLSTPHKERADLGDLVSFKVEPIETGAPVQWIRGQLGKLNLLPELSETVAALPVGESAVIKLHYPITTPQPLGGTSRIVRVSVLDVKPMGYPPTVEKELLIGVTGFIDPVFRTKKQVDQLLEHSREAA